MSQLIEWDKRYTYTGETFSKLENDKFSIIINKDGTFSYSESMLSSYIGMGTWTIEKDVLVLTEDELVYDSRTNYFRIDGNDLVFLEENSSNFIYVNVKDGERFTGSSFYMKE